MTKKIKNTTVNGFIWSFVDNFSVQIGQFITGIILARLLEPKEFGLIGMITIFITLSQWFISSGFGQALIRKKNCTDIDYSTVFVFNLITGLILYLILFFCAQPISIFFKEPQLASLVKVLGLSLIIISFSIIQQTQLTKQLDFKKQTKISIISAVTSGAIGISAALYGFEVWSLVFKSLSEYLIRTYLLWKWSRWRPSFVFSIDSFKELFGFGYKLMLRGLIYTLFTNIYYVIIGKYFSTAQLGFYTRAEQFNTLPSSNINKVVNNVSYPVLSSFQDDPIALKNAYKRILTSLVFITSISMVTLAAIAEPLIIVTVGEKWRPTIEILQPMCFVGLMYPLVDFNLTILKVKGMSGLILKLELLKRLISIPVIFIAVLYGIKPLIFAMIFLSVLEFIINAYFSGKQILYSVKEQIVDNLSNFIVAFAVGLIVFLITKYLETDATIVLLVGILSAFLSLIIICESSKNKSYIFLKTTITNKLKKS